MRQMAGRDAVDMRDPSVATAPHDYDHAFGLDLGDAHDDQNLNPCAPVLRIP